MEERITKLENQLKALQNAFLQSQKNQVPITAKTDDTANKVTELTPWTASKTAYIGDTEITFYDVPEGNVTVFLNGYTGNYSVNRVQDRLTVSFDALEDQTDITISIL